MKLALFQFAPRFGDATANVERMAAAVRTHDADLWIMPELATTGYLFADRSECSGLAEPATGPSLAAFAALCRERSTRIVVGFAERAGERLYNAAAYVTAAGVASVYRKVHLFDRERDCFDPGPDPFRAEPLGPHRLGLMICFDWLFPESARSLALLGADLIAHPANLVLPFCQAAMVTRALENGVFCATANRVGCERRAGVELTFTGGSQVVDPRGRVLAQADAESETVVLAEVDLAAARDKSITSRNDRLADLRPECYVRALEGWPR
jgi:predicted amidohydrolase